MYLASNVLEFHVNKCKHTPICTLLRQNAHECSRLPPTLSKRGRRPMFYQSGGKTSMEGCDVKSRGEKWSLLKS